MKVACGEEKLCQHLHRLQSRGDRQVFWRAFLRGLRVSEGQWVLRGETSAGAAALCMYVSDKPNVITLKTCPILAFQIKLPGMGQCYLHCRNSSVFLSFGPAGFTCDKGTVTL